LQLDPVFKRALVIAQVQTTRRAHPANDSLHTTFLASFIPRITVSLCDLRAFAPLREGKLPQKSDNFTRQLPAKAHDPVT
jgi:hypothetical protein